MLSEFDLENWVREHGAALVQAVSAEPSGSPVKITPISRGDSATVVEIRVGGSHVVAKLFDPDVSDSAALLDREVFNLQELGKLELAPRLLGFSRSRGFVVSAFVEGATVADTITENNVLELARKLGAWHRRYSEAMNHRPYAGNWGSYLAEYSDLLPATSRGAGWEQFGQMQIPSQHMSKNDAHLGNYIVSQDAILGIDFECATYKPAGWDILNLSRVLGRRFPADREKIWRQLVDAWGPTHFGYEIDQFTRLAAFFAESTAFTTPHSSRLA